MAVSSAVAYMPPRERRDVANVVAAAAAHSYTVLLDHTNGDWHSEALIVRGVRPHLIDGVILNLLALEMNDIQPDQVAVPVVLVGDRLFGAPCDHVVVDNVAAAREATAHLARLGRRRIAAIGMQEETSDDSLRLRLHYAAPRKNMRHGQTVAGAAFAALITLQDGPSA